MRRDDHVAANQHEIQALYQSRRRAVAECQGNLWPKAAFADRFLNEPEWLAVQAAWEKLSVEYLRAQWPRSMLN